MATVRDCSLVFALNRETLAGIYHCQAESLAANNTRLEGLLNDIVSRKQGPNLTHMSREENSIIGVCSQDNTLNESVRELCRDIFTAANAKR
jgi:hypothetical protein